MKPALRISGWLGVACILGVFFAACSGGGGGKVNVQSQVAGLKSADTNAVEDACIALAKAGEAAAPAVPDLIPLLRHKDPEVRRLAAYALGEIGPKAKAAIPALQELLTAEPNRRVQSQVSLSMGSIDPSNAPPVMPNVQ